MELATGVHHFDYGPFNWYLIEEERRLTLVDAGFPNHIGFAGKVRKETGVPVYVHREDAKMACKPLQLPWLGVLLNAWRAYTAKMLRVAIANGVFTFPHLSKVQTVENGQVLDVPGKSRILYTPGHTLGEIVSLLENREVLLSGDTIVTRNLFTGRLGSPQLTNPILNHNYKKAIRSLDLLRELGDVKMLPGHGMPG